VTTISTEFDANHGNEEPLVDEPAEPFEDRIRWRAGGMAGLIATVVMGVAVVVDATVLREAIAGLYGLVLGAGYCGLSRRS